MLLRQIFEVLPQIVALAGESIHLLLEGADVLLLLTVTVTVGVAELVRFILSGLELPVKIIHPSVNPLSVCGQAFLRVRVGFSRDAPPPALLLNDTLIHRLTVVRLHLVSVLHYRCGGGSLTGCPLRGARAGTCTCGC